MNDPNAIVSSVQVGRQGTGRVPEGIVPLSPGSLASQDLVRPVAYWAILTAEIPGLNGPQSLPGRFQVSVQMGMDKFPCQLARGENQSLVYLKGGLTPRPGPYSLRVYDAMEGFLKTYPIGKIEFAKRLMPTPANRTATVAGKTFEVFADGPNLRIRAFGSGKPGHTVAIQVTQTSWEALTLQPLGRVIPLGKDDRDTWFNANYPGQVDAVRLRVDELAPAHLHTTLQFPNIALKEQLGQPYLGTNQPSRLNPVPEVRFELSSNDTEVKRAAKMRKYVKVGLGIYGFVIKGSARLVSPELNDLGVGMLIEYPTLVGSPSFQTAWNQSFMRLNTQPIPAQQNPEPKYGPIDFALEVDLDYWKVVRTKSVDLAFPKNPLAKAAK